MNTPSKFLCSKTENSWHLPQELEVRNVIAKLALYVKQLGCFLTKFLFSVSEKILDLCLFTLYKEIKSFLLAF
jgi:hypothetical protein